MRPRWQIAVLTGQSDPGRCALSPSQRAFVTALAAEDVAVERCNFPWQDDATAPPWRNRALLPASWNNVRQYLATRSPGWTTRWRPAWCDLLARADRTLLLAGSCGLALLHGLRPTRAELARTAVLAYGPVTRWLPACPLLLVQGRSDWLSRHYVPRPDLLIACGHMNYLESPELLPRARRWLDQQRSRP